jgi:filamentous hemagglutinin family protein
MCILKFGIATVPSFLFCSIALTAQAQIIPDTTLPINSIATPDGNTSIITGGTKAGGNLFHSFEQFSIPTGTGAYFNNAIEIQNIFSRVTGNSISNIDGFISVNGTANLFLLNPNGIIFGPNALLDLGGSFVGSTADRLLFQDGSFYSATETQTVPLLAINVPIGLQFGANPGGIVNRSQVFDSKINAIAGLQVTSGNTLALVGGNIDIEGGTMLAIDGHLELGSVGANSRVNWTAQDNLFTFNYSDVQDFQDIQLSQQALVRVRDFGRGGMQIQGRRIVMTESSLMGIANNAETLPGGDIAIVGSEAIELNNDSILISATLQSGAGSSIVIETRRLSLQDGAGIVALSESGGWGGNLTIRSSESIEVSGNPSRGTFSALSVKATNAGNSGDLTLVTRQLRVWDGGFVGGSDEGQGNGGEIDITTEQLQVWGGAAVGGINYGTGRGVNLTISASEFVEVRGTSGDGTAPSLLAVGTLRAGDAGNLTIDTGRLLIRDGGQVTAGTTSQGDGGIVAIRAKDIELSGNFPNPSSLLNAGTASSGNAGSVSIETDRLRVFDGASVAAATTGSGRAGSITVRANSIELNGFAPNLMSSRGFSPSSLFAGTIGTGDAGSIAIDSKRLSIQNLAEVSVISEGVGNPGSIEVNADLLRLDNQGSFNAVSETGRGGNIDLNAANIQLRRQSEVSAAGSPNLPTSDGNIGINAETLVLIESSNIITDAANPSGGSNIDLAGLDEPVVVIQSRDSLINARGTLTIAGEINPNTTDLPQIEVPDVTRLLSGGCRDYRGSSFYVTGRGGIPPSPYDLFDGSAASDRTWVELADVPTGIEASAIPHSAVAEFPLAIMEAQGWIVGENGEIILTAAPYRGTPYVPGIPNATCDRN